MRSSSTRLRFGAAATATTLALFGLGGSAFAGEKGQGEAHRSTRTTASATSSTVTEDGDSDGTPNNVVDDGDNAHPSGNDRSVESGGSGDQGNSASTPDQDGHGPERNANGTDKPGFDGGRDVLDQDRNNGCGNDDDFEDDNEGWCGQKPTSAHPGHPGGVESGHEEQPCTGPMTGAAPGRPCSGDHECTGVMTGRETSTSAAEEECGGDQECTGVMSGATDEDTCGVGTTEGTPVVAPGAVLGSGLQSATPVALAAAEIPTRVLGVEIERGATEATGTSGGAGTGVLGATLARGSVLAFTGVSVGVLVLVALALLAVGWLLRRAGRREPVA